MIYRHKMAGFTILEVILALGIVMSVTLMIMSQYQQYKKDNEFSQLNYTVDMLFQGMTNYYSAYCRNPVNASGVISNPNNQSLDPRDTNSNPVSNNPFVVVKSGQNWLQSNNFIATSDWPPIVIPEVDATAGDHGYITQFNLTAPSPTDPQRAPTAFYNNTSTDGWEIGSSSSTIVSPLPLSSTGLTGVGQLYYWRAQVAVKLLGTTAEVNAYAKRLGADCTSTLSGGTVSPCSAGTPGNYVVWERSPSFGSSNTRSSMWLTTRRIKQSSQQYTNDDMYGATDTDWGKGTPVSWQGGNIYLCGG